MRANPNQIPPNQFHPAFSHYKDSILAWLADAHDRPTLILAHIPRRSIVDMSSEEIYPLESVTFKQVMLTRFCFRSPTVLTIDYRKQNAYWEWFGTEDEWHRQMSTDTKLYVSNEWSHMAGYPRYFLIPLPPYDPPQRHDGSGLL